MNLRKSKYGDRIRFTSVRLTIGDFEERSAYDGRHDVVDRVDICDDELSFGSGTPIECLCLMGFSGAEYPAVRLWFPRGTMYVTRETELL